LFAQGSIVFVAVCVAVCIAMCVAKDVILALAPSQVCCSVCYNVCFSVCCGGWPQDSNFIYVYTYMCIYLYDFFIQKSSDAEVR